LERTDSGAPPASLRFGRGFRVRRRAGGHLVATALARSPGGVYARAEDGSIARVHSGDVDWTACEPCDDAPPALVPGEPIQVRSAAGTLRGELAAAPAGGQLVVRLPHGAELPVPVEPIDRAHLLLIKAELDPGDPFEVKSKSGNLYTGFVRERVAPDRVVVELDSGKTADIRLDRLRLETLVVLLPVPVAYLRGEDAPLAEDVGARRSRRMRRPSGRQPRAAAAPSGETERLQRELLQQNLELERLKEERERLAQEKRDRERELESEVWRGYAVNRDLAETKRRLEELERALGERRGPAAGRAQGTE